MHFKVFTVMAAVICSSIALPTAAPTGATQDVNAEPASGAISDIMTAVANLQQNLNEFHTRDSDRAPSKFVALFPEFISRTLEANARLRGRPMTDAERQVIEHVRSLEKMIGEITGHVDDGFMSAYGSQLGSVLTYLVK
ncbi:uncharacterized protein [Macrobrachium rosenbergii]|uniref:uncharacterized protein n=1 Tax=Macrobrachium rosenbergii TaxID=79674 RepID=UPI0034D71F1B